MMPLLNGLVKVATFPMNGILVSVVVAIVAVLLYLPVKSICLVLTLAPRRRKTTFSMRCHSNSPSLVSGHSMHLCLLIPHVRVLFMIQLSAWSDTISASIFTHDQTDFEPFTGGRWR